MESPVRVERREETLVLTVDRPERRNAVDPSVHAGLAEGVALAEEDPSLRALVLTGAGGAFIAGGDLRFIEARPFEESLQLSAHMRDLLARLEALPIPVIAAIDGPAFGGGLEVALACDRRVGSRSAKLSFRQAAMGVTTGWGAAARLVSLVPRSEALHLLSAAPILGAEEALNAGLLDQVAEDPVEAALEAARALRATSPRAVAAFKRLLGELYAPTERARASETAEFEALWGGEDQREALAAFFERRPARWP